MRAVAEDDDLRQRLTNIGITVGGSSPEAFAAAIEEQRMKVAAIAAAMKRK